jgi:hypothetical protein
MRAVFTHAASAWFLRTRRRGMHTIDCDESLAIIHDIFVGVHHRRRLRRRLRRRHHNHASVTNADTSSLSVSLPLSLSLSLLPPPRLSLYLSICLSVCLSIYPPSPYSPFTVRLRVTFQHAPVWLGEAEAEPTGPPDGLRCTRTHARAHARTLHA